MEEIIGSGGTIGYSDSVGKPPDRKYDFMANEFERYPENIRPIVTLILDAAPFREWAGYEEDDEIEFVIDLATRILEARL